MIPDLQNKKQMTIFSSRNRVRFQLVYIEGHLITQWTTRSNQTERWRLRLEAKANARVCEDTQDRVIMRHQTRCLIVALVVAFEKRVGCDSHVPLPFQQASFSNFPR